MNGSRAFGVIFIATGITVAFWTGQARGWWASSGAPWGANSTSGNGLTNNGSPLTPITVPTQPKGDIGNPAGAPGGVPLYKP